ncbi:DUF4450 domain-containing protein [Thermoflavifilum thermophilum]|uniref:DUF4450 domain-containing protein n=1 Tax=Thermoflavifilum thermophilum TaxID=1393122 RepID=UPI0015A53CD3|nr:DUF4450 domain-containing protein [Thermoflavifilum thermophilum]
MNGKNKFDRSLYGWQTAFRVEAGDLPMFALYMPGTGGCLKLGVISQPISKWAESFASIESRYHAGKMIYTLQDPSIGQAKIRIEVDPLYTAHGMAVRIQVVHVKKPFQLILAFGGAGGIYPARNGDLGADSPDVFDITPAHCLNNHFIVQTPRFFLTYKNKNSYTTLEGILPATSEIKILDAKKMNDPVSFMHSDTNTQTPVLAGKINIKRDGDFFLVIKEKDSSALSVRRAKQIFLNAEIQRKNMANRIYVHTPDPFMNTIGSAMSIAANAIWQDSVFMHGAVAWRMPYNGWRGSYVANDLGWHERAKTFFRAYNKSQLTEPDTCIVAPDPKAHLSRQIEKTGLGIYNSGYICRYPNGRLIPGHYDMNLVYIDDMIRHFQWTGDTAFMRECWPVIKRHLDWEKRNFDQDHDHLFDAYACIWASDALEYSGGDVSYSSAYNYFQHKLAGEIASLLHENPLPFENEAQRIRNALLSKLWIPQNGSLAEFQDLTGARNLHPDAGLWTVYHAIDEEVTNPFQTYQLLQYINHDIPHQYFTCPGIPGKYFELSTTDWMPYTWSVNNVAMAEMAHAALAYWEGGQKRTAFQLWKSLILESMYLGNCPGNFEQLSSLDHFRGELYRDFADPIGICARTLVEGLFGIWPDAIHHRLFIIPGWPDEWRFATIRTPDIHLEFHRNLNTDHYVIEPRFETPMGLDLCIPVDHIIPSEIWVNQHQVNWIVDSSAIGYPRIVIYVAYQPKYDILIKWSSDSLSLPAYQPVLSFLDTLRVNLKQIKFIQMFDPQNIVQDVSVNDHQLKIHFRKPATGYHSFFIQLAYHGIKWWYPIDIYLQQPIGIQVQKKANHIYLQLINRSHLSFPSNQVQINASLSFEIPELKAYTASSLISIPDSIWFSGTNRILVSSQGKIVLDTIWTDWEWTMHSHFLHQKEISCDSFFNARVQDIFRKDYLSPRPHVPTLQLPIQGIGNWTAPLIQPHIEITGWLQTSKHGKTFFPNGVSILCPHDSIQQNIAFVSIWSNYPDSITIPIYQSARHAYFLMTGTTNPMQTHITNGKIIAWYMDGTCDSLQLINPDTWWPIEQDYYIDSFAFPDQTPVPYRLHLKTGEITRLSTTYSSLPGFTNRAIDGGAATLLDMPLNPNKTLSHFTVRATTNEVIIGLMGITLIQ